MFSSIYKYCFLILLTLASVGVVFSQADGEKADQSKKIDLPEGLRETMAKRRIKEEEKEYQELIKKSEETVKLSAELSKSFEENQKLSPTDAKKLEQLEKLIKKIRRELGAEEDKEEKEEDNPSSIMNALNKVKEKTVNLVSELKKTSRHSISVIAVESSNALWKIVRFLRFSKN